MYRIGSHKQPTRGYPPFVGVGHGHGHNDFLSHKTGLLQNVTQGFRLRHIGNDLSSGRGT
jgi:hypothetical protein